METNRVCEKKNQLERLGLLRIGEVLNTWGGEDDGISSDRLIS